MNSDQIEGQWKVLKGKIKQRWSRLTDDDLAQINGKREELVGRIQARYGLARERVERDLNELGLDR